MVRAYARALRGERARGKKPQKRGKNVSLLSALSLEEVVAFRNIYGAVNGATFEAFIAKDLVPQLWKNACVVMDNAKFHQGEMVRELIEQAGAKLIYLPGTAVGAGRSSIKLLIDSQKLTVGFPRPPCPGTTSSPYSPEFSPIENFWSKVKAILKKLKPRTYKDLINGIAEAMLKVTNSEIRNWFAHCCYYTSLVRELL